MKKLLLFLFVTVFLLGIGCTKKDTQDTSVPDPAGTITTNLSSNSFLILWKKNIVRDQFGNFNIYTTYLEMNVAAVTDQIGTTVNTGTSTNGYMLQGETADMGEVHGLGNVTEKPVTGFTFYSALIKGHGYVIRYKEGIDYTDATLPYVYGRFYLVDYQLDVFGEIAGVTINYQGTF
jgi:hypothetical protein